MQSTIKHKMKGIDKKVLVDCFHKKNVVVSRYHLYSTFIQNTSKEKVFTFSNSLTSSTGGFLNLLLTAKKSLLGESDFLKNVTFC